MPRKSSFDREDLLEAALKVARRVGLDALSMRMVAEELGVSTMAPYRHFPSREALVACVADELAAHVQVPPPESGTWDERLSVLERAAFRACIEVPGAPANVVLTEGPNYRRIAEGAMAILGDGGFSDEDAAVAFEVIWAYFQGQVRIYDLLTSRSEDFSTLTPLLWPGLAKVIEHFPRLSPEDFFDRGFEILLDGLRHRIAAR